MQVQQTAIVHIFLAKALGWQHRIAIREIQEIAQSSQPTRLGARIQIDVKVVP